jgi:hypothetical protein
VALPSLVSDAELAANALVEDVLNDYALVVQPKRQIATLLIDVPVREVHVDSNTITSHPVQTGTPVSDHVYANPKRLEMTVGFSDSTAGFVGYSQQVYEFFQALDATREPFSVSTGKRLYDNMVFAEIVVTTDATSEYALALVATLQEVIISTTGDSSLSSDTQATPQETQAVSDQGSQPAYPVTTPQPQLVGGVGGMSAPNPGSGGIGSA